MLNSLAIIFFSLLLFFLCAAVSSVGEYVDVAVAVINDDVIVETEIEKAGGEHFERNGLTDRAG